MLDATVIAWGDANGTRGAGSIRIQDSTAFATSPTGTYAFRLSGWDVSNGHFALAGVATAGTGLFTNVTADVNDSGTVAGPLSGGDGSFSSADTNGRGTATLGIGATTWPSSSTIWWMPITSCSTRKRRLPALSR